MPQKVSIDVIPDLRDSLFDLVARIRKDQALLPLRRPPNRGQRGQGRRLRERDGQVQRRGLRLLVRGPRTRRRALNRPGYFGEIVGTADLPRIAERVREGLDHAYDRAVASARGKEGARSRFGVLGSALASLDLAPIDVRQDTIDATYKLDPREVPLEDTVHYVREACARVAALDKGIAYSHVSAFTVLERQLFVSTEGANIQQSRAITQGTCFVVAAGSDGAQELYDFTGHQRGWELITEGADEEFIKFPNLMDFSVTLARDTVALCACKPLKATAKDVVVVTNPHYNALVCHEVVGHPTELDRALKYETGYAGRSWLLKDLKDNQLGKRVGSDLVSAFSDPNVDAYGYYAYDDEGTPAKRIYHIDKGTFNGFSNSRQTAALTGAEPNGHFKATDASFVPLIRMSNTAFAPGDSDPDDIIKEVEHGYYVVGHRIPSIAESRENFRITAMKVYEINKGEIGEMFRDGGLMSDTRDYFMNVDAVGTDFQLFAIPNCGKGQPMQTKRMSNGGPTMRSRARLSGR